MHTTTVQGPETYQAATILHNGDWSGDVEICVGTEAIRLPGWVVEGIVRARNAEIAELASQILTACGEATARHG
jgi:hypothetical protein